MTDPTSRVPDDEPRHEWLMPSEETEQPWTDAAPYERDQSPAQPVRGAGWRGVSRGRKAMVLAAASLLTAGGVAVATAGDSGASPADASSATAGQAPGGLAGGPDDHAGPDGAQGPGGIAGEQHIEGTLTAKAANTITVRPTSGASATYSVTASTEVVRNGANTTLAAVKVGDPVVVHVLPTSSAGHLEVERLFAGTMPAGGPGPGGGSGPDPSDPNDGRASDA